MNQNIWCIEIEKIDLEDTRDKLEPKHMMYWNEYEKKIKPRYIGLEPKHMMYWNPQRSFCTSYWITWTKTYDVLKLKEYNFSEYLCILEPKHMMYWNSLLPCLSCVKGLSLNQNIWCIEIEWGYVASVNGSLEPKHMMYWNKVALLSKEIAPSWTKTYDVLK